MNRYLEKIAKDTGKKIKEGASVSAGAYLVSKAPEKVLGYHTLYHGTSKGAADKIKKNGFDPKRGGKGQAAFSSEYAKNSEGKVHFTKNKILAKMYAGNPSEKIRVERAKEGGGNPLKAMWGAYKDHKSGAVLKTRVSESMYSKFEVDRDSSPGAPKELDSLMKDRASTTNKKVGAEFVSGSTKDTGIRKFLTKNHLRRTYAMASGRKRAVVGALQAATGVALGSAAIKSNKERGGFMSKDSSK